MEMRLTQEAINGGTLPPRGAPKTGILSTMESPSPRPRARPSPSPRLSRQRHRSSVGNDDVT
jgi:hypothetical protein